MYSLMIVDDDPILCDAMCVKAQLIRKESGLDFCVSAVAHSVSEAWSLFQQQPADIVITDIQMPYQSGLELIAQVDAHYPDTQLIVLSGYSDYDYMRGALHGGVTDYLLKPIRLCQLREVLVKCAQNVDRQRSFAETRGLQQEQFFHLELEHALNGLLTGAPEDAPVLEKPKPPFQLALLSMAHPEAFAQLLHDFSFSGKAGSNTSMCFVTDPWSHPVLLFFQADALKNEISYTLEALCHYMREQGHACCAAFSHPFESWQQYAAMHKQARRALSWQLLRQFTVISASDYPQKSSLKTAELLSACCRCLHMDFQSRNFDRLNALLSKYFTPEFFSYTDATPHDIKSLYTYFLTQAQETATSFDAQLEDPPHFSSFVSFDALLRYCKELLAFLQEQSERGTGKNQHIIDTAIRYIEENYNREINMNDAAGAVSMSYSYFSKFFKEQTHQSFSEYLTGIRMREAKKLLEEDPSIKVKDIAALVGYESVYSFSRAFKQFYNYSPKQTH